MNPGAVAQLGERELCKLEVVGSIPIGSTSRTTHVCVAEIISFDSCDALGARMRSNSLTL
jgi:hypothetical protein